MKKNLFTLLLVSLLINVSQAQTLYYPPAAPQSWDTISPLSLNWCPDKIDSLYEFLEQKNTKGFILLKDGKIVLEKYFGTFTEDSIWYWASAGKTLTAFLTGIAQQEGFLNINQNITQYLGNGWSACSIPQEDSITIKQLLCMTSGLDDVFPPCTNEDDTPTCLSYLAAPETRWAYHTGAYRKLQDVLPLATSTNLNVYTNTKVKNKIDMSSGIWLQDVYYSKTRDAARFGLLCLSKGIWANDTVLNDSVYFNQMTNTSQNHNLAYGYLTWLNGKNNFMLPGTQLTFNGFITPNAPADMYAALGKNDQKIYVVPSQNMVVVRFGEAAYSSALSITVFDDELWQKIGDLNCNVTTAHQMFDITNTAGPNPFYDYLNVYSSNQQTHYCLTDYTGKVLYNGNLIAKQNFAALPIGIYFLKTEDKGKVQLFKLVKAN
ncbi:MAG: serine hydrolase [Chitinophagales bacterium]|nr:serine hydrolase [Chitinophagales bacterium]